MNELSWLIYLADVAGSVNVLSAIAIVVLTGLTGAAIFVNDAYRAESWDYDNAQHEKHKGTPSSVYYRPPTGPKPEKFPYRAYASPLLVGVVASAILNIAVPSKETIYAIAASQFGESVLKSETGGKAVEALNGWLDRQIEPK